MTVHGKKILTRTRLPPGIVEYTRINFDKRTAGERRRAHEVIFRGRLTCSRAFERGRGNERQGSTAHARFCARCWPCVRQGRGAVHCWAARRRTSSHGSDVLLPRSLTTRALPRLAHPRATVSRRSTSLSGGFFADAVAHAGAGLCRCRVCDQRIPLTCLTTSSIPSGTTSR